MDRLTQRLRLARAALDTFEELAAMHQPTEVERDAAIQRFEYTVEAMWKAAQAVLDARFGVSVASPKAAIRACAQNGVLAEADARAAMSVVDDRNLTSHTYNRALAVALASRLPGHADLLGRWLAHLEAAAAAP